MSPSDTSSLEDLHKEYDYVVVGGGTTGLVVANRLTELPYVNVLLLEAGSNRLDDPRIQVPGLAVSTYSDPEFDWCIETTPQAGLNGRVLSEPRGKTLGGSSAINLGMAIYPSQTDINAWEELGNEGWSWKTMSECMKKSQTLTPPSAAIKEELSIDYIDPSVQGTSGPIQISFGEGPFPACNGAWPKTFQTLNKKITGDPMSGIADGAYCNPGTVHPITRHRSHAGSAYYNEEVAKRPNLRVVTEALVQKILLEKVDDKDPKVVATGVIFIGKDGVKRTIAAKNELILAAGALKTPQLLEISGIGNGALLRKHGIEPIINLDGVGENCQEHGFVPFSWEVMDDQVTAEALRDPVIAAGAMEMWQKNGSGPLGLVALHSSYATPPELKGPEIAALLEEHLKEDDLDLTPGLKAQYAILTRMLKDENEPIGQFHLGPFQITPEKGPSVPGVFGMTEPECYYSIVAILNRPFSRGSTHLVSTDIQDSPEFDIGFFKHPIDIQLHGRLTRWLETIAETAPMASLFKPGGRRLQESSPDISIEQAMKLTRERIVAHYHVCGTTAMMPRELNGVVDSKLRVYGTKNLRIVDAGIIPIIPRGNIQSLVFAIGEKAAELIVADVPIKSSH
ncbi:CAZyme family AA3 [Penicillium taxi]|uniref:CAZyme family AA3 n=1 Tax=Penicillium taxi TaxID=168475 RepID=UPI002545ACEA|nr:CAZyme family AA3 [Penicillium taxi]KAJ5885544.1 CAZyme family AA3 [Penicillium taxi]